MRAHLGKKAASMLYKSAFLQSIRTLHDAVNGRNPILHYNYVVVGNTLAAQQLISILAKKNQAVDTKISHVAPKLVQVTGELATIKSGYTEDNVFQHGNPNKQLTLQEYYDSLRVHAKQNREALGDKLQHFFTETIYFTATPDLKLWSLEFDQHKLETSQLLVAQDESALAWDAFQLDRPLKENSIFDFNAVLSQQSLQQQLVQFNSVTLYGHGLKAQAIYRYLQRHGVQATWISDVSLPWQYLLGYEPSSAELPYLRHDLMLEVGEKGGAITYKSLKNSEEQSVECLVSSVSEAPSLLTQVSRQSFVAVPIGDDKGNIKAYRQQYVPRATQHCDYSCLLFGTSALKSIPVGSVESPKLTEEKRQMLDVEATSLNLSTLFKLPRESGEAVEGGLRAMFL